MSLDLLQSLEDMSRHERDFLGQMPVNDKGKGAREGEMSLHIAVQLCPRRRTEERKEDWAGGKSLRLQGSYKQVSVGMRSLMGRPLTAVS